MSELEIIKRQMWKRVLARLEKNKHKSKYIPEFIKNISKILKNGE